MVINEKDKKINLLLEDLASLESYIYDLFDFSPLPICFISAIGVVLEFNPAFEKISGFKSHEIVGEGIEKIFDKYEIESVIKEVLGREEVAGKKAILLSKDKKEIPVSIFAKTKKGEEGGVTGIFIGVFDISEIKKTEEELQEKVAQLERFERLAVDRELKITELREDMENLKRDGR